MYVLEVLGSVLYIIMRVHNNDSIARMNCAVATFHPTITKCELWCTVTLVAACHCRSGVKFTEMCQKLALWAVGHWRLSFTVNINHRAGESVLSHVILSQTPTEHGDVSDPACKFMLLYERVWCLTYPAAALPGSLYTLWYSGECTMNCHNDELQMWVDLRPLSQKQLTCWSDNLSFNTFTSWFFFLCVFIWFKILGSCILSDGRLKIQIWFGVSYGLSFVCFFL